MAGIFDLALVAGRTDNIVARICSAALESACHLIPSQSNQDVVRTVGAIVSTAGFPEFGIPIARGGYLPGRWMNSGLAARGTAAA
jgi:hypothetical protein